MNWPVYLVSMVFATLLAWGCLTVILIYLEPTAAQFPISILFYLSLFMAAAGALFFIGFSLRRISCRKGIILEQLHISFRQGILLAIILVGALILQSQRVLAWWNLLALVAVVGLLEWWATRK